MLEIVNLQRNHACLPVFALAKRLHLVIYGHVSTGVAALTQEGLSACADALRGQGFFVKEKEIDAPLYEFDAIKDNQEWKVKMSGNCEIVLQKLD